MTLSLDPTHIVWDQFQGLEAVKPEWLEQEEYWEQYTEAFFRSNGLVYRPEDSNVRAWLSAEDRAPFAFMADALLGRLETRVDLTDVEFVLLAHWLPDLHLGTSVTNFVMHRLKLGDCFGFAISDHGLSAPFYALDCMRKFLKGGRTRGLLLMMDQKHLLYRSDIVDRVNPANSACVISLDTRIAGGMDFLGYERVENAGHPSRQSIKELVQRFGIHEERLTVIADESLVGESGLLDDPEHEIATTDTSLLCSAPFARLAEIAAPGRDYMLLTQDPSFLSGVAFRFGEG